MKFDKIFFIGLGIMLWSSPGPALAQPAATPGGSTSGTPSTTRVPTGLQAADRDFVMDAAQGGLLEVQLGAMAMQKGSPAVKKFGQEMVKDHTRANNDLKTVAAAKGITLPTQLDAKHKAIVDKMAALKGAAFDRAYEADMLKDHKEDVAKFKKEAASGQDASVKSFAARTLPTLEKHLAHITALAKSAGIASGK